MSGRHLKRNAAFFLSTLGTDALIGHFLLTSVDFVQVVTKESSGLQAECLNTGKRAAQQINQSVSNLVRSIFGTVKIDLLHGQCWFHPSC